MVWLLYRRSVAFGGISGRFGWTASMTVFRYGGRTADSVPRTTSGRKSMILVKKASISIEPRIDRRI
jgi:hypothetical protein